MIIIIKNHNGKISIEFPESVNLEKSYFTIKQYRDAPFRWRISSKQENKAMKMLKSIVQILKTDA